MASQVNLLITPADGGAWAIRSDEAAPASSLHASQAQAIAGAWELVSDLGEAKVIIQNAEGRVLATLTVGTGSDPEARAEAMRITPSYERIRAGIARGLPPVEGADLDADPADLY